MKLCGQDYPSEPETEMPEFWPVARAWAASGGHLSLSSGLQFHHGQVAVTIQNTLYQHAPEGEQPYIHRADVSRQRAYSALVGINRHPCKRCRKELAAAFLDLFDPEAHFGLIRTNKPHGAGLLVTDRTYVGIIFAEFTYHQSPGWNT